VLAGDLLEPRAQLGVVLLRVAERLLGCSLPLLAQLVGHPQVEAVEHPAVAAKGLVPLALPDQVREIPEPAGRVQRRLPQEVRREP
jgi:hypothetical protein